LFPTHTIFGGVEYQQPYLSIHKVRNLPPPLPFLLTNNTGGCYICKWTVDTKSNPIQWFGANTYLATLAYPKTCMCSCVSASGLCFSCTFYNKTCFRQSSNFHHHCLYSSKQNGILQNISCQ
jgi:hypothetical protein